MDCGNINGGIFDNITVISYFYNIWNRNYGIISFYERFFGARFRTFDITKESFHFIPAQEDIKIIIKNETTLINCSV